MMSESIESPAQKVQLNFIICASLLDKLNISTGDYFYGQKIFGVNDYQKDEFIEKIQGADKLYSYEFEELIFEFLAAGSDHVRGSDLYEAVDSYRRTKPKDKIKQEKREMTNTDVARNMQKIRRETLLRKVNQAIVAKGYTPLGVYNMVDEQNQGNLSVEQLRKGFQKLLPKLTAEDITELAVILDCNKNGFIDRQEYAVIMMDQDEGMKKPQNLEKKPGAEEKDKESLWRQDELDQGDQAQPSKIKDAQKSKQDKNLNQRSLSQSEVQSEKLSEKSFDGELDPADRSHLSLAVLDDYIQGKATDIDKLIARFRSAMRENHINLKEIFGLAVVGQKNYIPTLMAYNQIRLALPPNQKDIKEEEIIEILRFIDQDFNGIIEEDEFIAAIGYDKNGVAMASSESDQVSVVPDTGGLTKCSRLTS